MGERRSQEHRAFFTTWTNLWRIGRWSILNAFFTHLTSETSSAGLNQHLSSDKQPSGNRDQLYPLQNRTVGTGTMFVGFKFNEWHCHYGTINNPSIMLVFVKDDAKTARKVETTNAVRWWQLLWQLFMYSYHHDQGMNKRWKLWCKQWRLHFWCQRQHDNFIIAFVWFAFHLLPQCIQGTYCGHFSLFYTNVQILYTICTLLKLYINVHWVSSGKKYKGYRFKTSQFSTNVAGILNIQIIWGKNWQIQQRKEIRSFFLWLLLLEY